MKKKKLVGRLGIEAKDVQGIEANYVRYQLFLRVYSSDSEHTYRQLAFSAQASADSPECTYALRCTGFDLGEHDSLFIAEFLAKLVKRMRLEKAPKPFISNGRAYSGDSEVHQLAQVLEKMGVEVRFFSEPLAYGWATDAAGFQKTVVA